MSDPKGKGKAAAVPSKEGKAPSSSTINNLINNVASSASGLARSAFAAPSSNELSSASSLAVLGSGKGQSSSANLGSSAYAESSKPTAQSSSIAGQPQTAGAQPQGFRTAQEHAAATEAEFSSFLDTIPALDADTTFAPTEPTFVPSQSQPSDDFPHPASRQPFNSEEFIRYSAHSPPHSLTPSLAPTSSYKTVQDAQVHDGADVLAILDTFKPDELDYFEPQTIEQEVEDWKLTPEQFTLAKKLAAELHITPAVDHSGNMVPRAFQDREKAEFLPEEYAWDTYSHLGEVLEPEKAKRKWIEMWDGVLNNYQDEVWGGMAPLVKEAKQEIKDIVEETDHKQPVALRRLGLVLGHMSGVQTPASEVVEKQEMPDPTLDMDAQYEETLINNLWRGGAFLQQHLDSLAQNRGAVVSPQVRQQIQQNREIRHPGASNGPASNYGPQVYMQPEQSAQAKEYQTWFENAGGKTET